MRESSDLQGGGDFLGDVVIELSEGQVDGIVHAASEARDMSLLLSRIKSARDAVAATPEHLHDSRLSGSLLVGLLILAAFPTNRNSMRNVDLARTLDISPSKTYRYVATLVAVGLVEREPGTGRYRLTSL
jgi:DNA-binding MarR family transcriptional regulator